MTVEEQRDSVRAFVQGVVDCFGLEAETSARIEEEEIFVDVTGADLGLLVGQRGSTLDALQELARTVVQRRTNERGARVSVDVGGFRAKRTAALAAFVERIAADVRASGTPQALEPMSAADRKIVHDTAAGIEGVTTTSEGVDPRRHVVIRPADEPPAVDESVEDLDVEDDSEEADD